MSRQSQISLLKRLLHYVDTRTTALADAPWPPELASDVAAVTTADFDIVDRDAGEIDDSLDLIAIAVRL